MTSLFSIGEFSRLSHLTVKALRHYHEVGLLEPAQVDASSGYRRYEAAQLSQARIIRRLRVLDMPLEEVRDVLFASNEGAQQSAIAGHLERMESDLQRTRDVVASLRSLLTEPIESVEVAYRTIPETQSVAISEHVERVDTAKWCEQAFTELWEVVESHELEPTGPPAGIFPSEFITEGEAEIVAFVPVVSAVTSGRVAGLLVPEGTFAVATHTGPFANLDCCYGPLGTFVAEHNRSAGAPFREYYVDTPTGVEDQSAFKTEVCWPVAG
ncbi:MAG: MerR family transcriptional regulator [Acidimicrobiales bacterium]